VTQKERQDRGRASPLAEVREGLGLTRQDLCLYAGVDYTSLYNFEQGFTIYMPRRCASGSGWRGGHKRGRAPPVGHRWV
jgi:DNA-binding XRE family transcriptional regulator